MSSQLLQLSDVACPIRLKAIARLYRLADPTASAASTADGPRFDDAKEVVAVADWMLANFLQSSSLPLSLAVLDKKVDPLWRSLLTHVQPKHAPQMSSLSSPYHSQQEGAASSTTTPTPTEGGPSDANAAASSVLVAGRAKRVDPVAARLAAKREKLLQNHPSTAAAAAGDGGLPTTAAAEDLLRLHWSTKSRTEMTGISYTALKQHFGIQVSRQGKGGAQSLSGRNLPAPPSASPLSTAASSMILPHPIRCWEELCGRDDADASTPSLRCSLLLSWVQQTFWMPTPIQLAALPAALHRTPVAPPSLVEKECSTTTTDTTTTTASQGDHLSYRYDVMGIAATGSGKTLCYLLPLLDGIVMDMEPMHSADRMSYGPSGLIVLPTRELAEQVARVAQGIVAASASLPQSPQAGGQVVRTPLTSVRIVKVVGGESAEAQHEAISQGAHLVIGTTGQLLRLCESRYLILPRASLIAVDEIDRMIDEEGALGQLYELLEKCPVAPTRQLLLFSATLDTELEKLAARFCVSPLGIVVCRTPHRFTKLTQTFEVFLTGEDQSDEGRARAPRGLRGAQQPTGSGLDGAEGEEWTVLNEKVRRLVAVLSSRLTQQSQSVTQTLVFVNTKERCEQVVMKLRQELRGSMLSGGGQSRPLPDSAIAFVHGSSSQAERSRTLELFRNKQISILVATDLIARGLDVDVFVVNFDMPDAVSKQVTAAASQYVHRVGRAGRHSEHGDVLSFVCVPAASASEGLATQRQQAADKEALENLAAKGPRCRDAYVDNEATPNEGFLGGDSDDEENEGGSRKRRREEETKKRPSGPQDNDDRPVMVALFSTVFREAFPGSQDSTIRRQCLKVPPLLAPMLEGKRGPELR